MNAKEIKEQLNEDQIMQLLEGLDASPQNNNNVIVSRTVCHHGGKHKLLYYKDSNNFYCYTDCGLMDIFQVIQQNMDLDFYNAFQYVCSKFGFSSNPGHISSNKVEASFFDKFNKAQNDQPAPPLPIIDSSILQAYTNIYHQSWINDGISIRSMQKYQIMFSVLNNQIIIPHFNEHGELIGVRARNLHEELVDEGKKYMPVFHKGSVLKHPTGQALYGLHANRKDIEAHGMIILGEAEKFVLQLDSFFSDMSIGVGLSSGNFTTEQLEIIKDLDIDEVVIALDKEFDYIGSENEKFYADKIQRVFVNRLLPFFNVSVIWDTDGLLNEKDSPTDQGAEVFSELLKNRIKMQ